MNMKQEEMRENLAKSDFCRAYLHVQGFLTDAENEKVFRRMRKWQDKHKVGITEAQLLSVDMTYNDNANKEDKPCLEEE